VTLIIKGYGVKVMETLRMHENNGKLKTIEEIKKNYAELKKFKMKDGVWIPKVIIGDVREIVNKLPNNFIDCIITSPPYWMQRDYGHPKQIGREKTPRDYVDEIVKIFKKLKPKLKRTSVIFLNVGYKFLREELLLIPEMIALEMQKIGFILKNKIIWYKPNAMPTPARNRLNNVYEPILVFVRKDGKEVYYFNVDSIAEQPKTLPEYLNALAIKPKDLLGIKITDSLTSRDSRKGKVIGVRHINEKPVEILIEWTDGSREYVKLGHMFKSYPEDVNFQCPLCEYIMDYWDICLSFANFNILKCPSCERILCKDENSFPRPLIKDDNLNQDLLHEIISEDVVEKENVTAIPKASKFRKMGIVTASPAGRLAVMGEKLTIKRRWRIPQPLICEYLRYWRVKRRIPIEDVDRALGYKYTAGHWFRRDFNWWGKGGSIPRPSDWLKLKQLLKFNNVYDRLVTETIAILETVKPHEKGKNPGDVWRIKLEQYPEIHFAIFPKELVRRCLLLGCPPGGVVLDPFAGSGTVGEVAMELGRKSILIELIESYVELIRKRCGKVEVIKMS